MGLTKLGLVELTRKKVHPSLSELLLTTCPHCGGTGKISGRGGFKDWA
jgi:ribonuclease G